MDTLFPRNAERDAKELEFRVAACTPIIGTQGWGTQDLEDAVASTQPLCESVADTPLVARTLYMQWGYGTWTSRHHLALEASNTLLDLADRADDRIARLMGHGLLGRVQCYLGDFIDGRDNIQQSLDLYDEEADASLALQYGQDPAMAGYGGLCWCLWMLGDFHGALAARDRTIQVAEATNHPQTLCYALGISSGWYGLRALEPAALRPWSGRFSASSSLRIFGIGEALPTPYAVGCKRDLASRTRG